MSVTELESRWKANFRTWNDIFSALCLGSPCISEHEVFKPSFLAAAAREILNDVPQKASVCYTQTCEGTLPVVCLSVRGLSLFKQIHSFVIFVKPRFKEFKIYVIAI